MSLPVTRSRQLWQSTAVVIIYFMLIILAPAKIYSCHNIFYVNPFPIFTLLSSVVIKYDFLREKSEFRARTLRSAEHALAFSETWSNTIIDFLMKINNL